MSLVTIPWLGAYGVPVGMIGGLLVASLLWIAVAKGLMQPPSIPGQAARRPRRGGGDRGGRAGGGSAPVARRASARAGIVALVSYLTALLAFGAVPRRHLRPLWRSGARRRASRHRRARIPPLGLGHLDSGQRSLLAAIERDGAPIVVLAERFGRSERDLRREYTVILRKLIGARAAEPRAGRAARRLLALPRTRGPARRRRPHDHRGRHRGIRSDGAQRGRQAAARTAARGLGRVNIETPSHRGHRLKLATLIEHLTALPEPHRRAAVIALRDGLTPAQIAAETGLSEQLVAREGRPGSPKRRSARPGRTARRRDRHGTARLPSGLQPPARGSRSRHRLRPRAQAQPPTVAGNRASTDRDGSRLRVVERGDI